MLTRDDAGFTHLYHDPTYTDATIALDFAVRDEYDAAADVSGDGRITSLDALIILQMAAGISAGGG
ncbi:MAG: hypothetical protein EF812_00740 [Methanosarcinales archaeon]|nr:MAG: hypothetical protein EF812_00740 [Methanosarcinales archaeon]